MKPGGNESHGRAVLSGLSRVLDIHQYVLSEDPSLFFQQTYNTLEAEWAETTAFGRRLREEAQGRPRPWMKLLSRPAPERDPRLRRVISAAGSLFSVAVSREGVIAASSFEGVIFLWDLETGKPLGELRGHTTLVRAVAVSPDGRWLASGSADRSARVWELPQGTLLHVFGDQEGEVSAVAFSPDGSILATGDRGGMLQLWRLPEGRSLRVDQQDFPITALAFSPKGSALATGHEDGTVGFWDAPTGEMIWKNADIHLSVNCLSFSPDGNHLAGGGYDDAVKIWDAGTGSLERSVGGREGVDALDWSKKTYVRSLAFSPDGRRLAGGFECWMGAMEVRLWDCASWDLVQTFRGHLYQVDLGFSDDGNSLVTVGSEEVRVWDLNTPESKSGRASHLDWIGPASFSPDGKLLASGSGNPDSEFKSADARVLVWDADHGSLKATLAGHAEAAVAIAFVPRKGATLASASYDDSVKLWEAETGRCLKTMKIAGGPICLAMSNDGRVLAAGNYEKNVVLGGLDADAEFRILRGHEHWVTAVAFSPDNGALASGDEKGTLRIWDTRTGDTREVLDGRPNGTTAVAWGPSGRILASAGSSTLTLWDLQRGGARWTSSKFWKRWIAKLMFSQDGRVLVAGDFDGAVRLLDVEMGNLLAWTPGSGQVLALWLDSSAPKLRVAERARSDHAPNFSFWEMMRLS